MGRGWFEEARNVPNLGPCERAFARGWQCAQLHTASEGFGDDGVLSHSADRWVEGFKLAANARKVRTNRGGFYEMAGIDYIKA